MKSRKIREQGVIEKMAETNIGKITQIIGAVLDIKFQEGHLPAQLLAVSVAPTQAFR